MESLKIIRKLNLKIKDNKKQLLILSKVLLTLVGPILLWFYIFRPFYSIKLQPNAVHYIITPPQTESYFRRSLIAEMIEAPLNLDYQRVCIFNKGLLTVNNNPIQREQIEKYNTDIGIAKIDVNNGNATTTLSIKPFTTECVRLHTDNKNINIYFGSLYTKVKDGGFDFFQENFQPNFDPTKPLYVIGINLDNIEISYRNNVIEALLAKLVVIFVFVNSLILLVMSIWDFYFKKEKK